MRWGDEDVTKGDDIRPLTFLLGVVISGCIIIMILSLVVGHA